MKVCVYSEEWYPVLTVTREKGFGDFVDVPITLIKRYEKWEKEYGMIVKAFEKLNITWR